MILEMLLHRNEIQKRIFQTQSDCATFEMKTDPTEPFSSLPPQFIFNKFCSLGVSWEVAVWRRNDKLIMNSISPHTLPGSQLCRSWQGRVYIWYLLMKSLHDSLNIPQPIRVPVLGCICTRHDQVGARNVWIVYHDRRDDQAKTKSAPANRRGVRSSDGEWGAGQDWDRLNCYHAGTVGRPLNVMWDYVNFLQISLCSVDNYADHLILR